MTDIELPDDIRSLLDTAINTDGHALHSSIWLEQAKTLRAKYTPKPETLADFGTIRWARVWTPGENVYPSAQMIEGHPEYDQYVDADNLHLFDATKAPWPEVEGIDPLPLFNNGWQLRKLLNVPENFEILAFSDLRGRFVPNRPMGFENGVVVLCRPPQPPAPISALTEQAHNRENNQ